MTGPTIGLVHCGNCDSNNYDVYIFYNTWYHLIFECKSCYTIKVLRIGDSYSQASSDDTIRRLLPERLVMTMTTEIKSTKKVETEP